MYLTKNKEVQVMPRLKDITGQKFNRLTVICRDGVTSDGKAAWLCVCECGNIITVNGKYLRTGHTKSCGCYRNELSSKRTTYINYKHGLSKTRLYNTYKNMLKRCYDMTNDHYKYYGALGVQVCDDWKNDFISFYQWAISNGYETHLTIDRRNPYGNYEPLNCRWVTMQEQAKNKRKDWGKCQI
jgi:hypothetical protein